MQVLVEEALAVAEVQAEEALAEEALAEEALAEEALVVPRGMWVT